MTNPYQLTQLADELGRRGVDLPSAAIHGLELLRAATHERLLERPSPPSLLTLSEAELRSHIEHLAFLDGLRAEVGQTAAEVAKALAGEAASVLRDGLDEILAQLRPEFDAAGEAVHAAARLGILPGSRADAVIGLGDVAVEAWRALPGHVRVLDATAELRIRLADVLDVDPLPDPFNHGQRAYAACFSTSGGLWTVRNEDTRDRWLRLASGVPVRLLSVAETRRAATPYQLEPRPEVIEDEDGLRYIGPAPRVPV